MDRRRVEWVLAANVESVGHARTLVAEELLDLSQESLEIAVLLASELVTNAVLHGRGPVGLAVARSDEAVQLEVSDESPIWPVLRSLDSDASNGRGLLFVDRLASRWGVRPDGLGKVVWFII